jgi:hypothetical protein
MTIFSFIVLMSSFLKVAQPQGAFETGSNDFGFTLGLNEYQVRENVLNNIRHCGVMPALGFSFEKSQELSNQKAALFLYFSQILKRPN